MKFYIDNNDNDNLFFAKIIKDKLTAIYTNIYIKKKNKKKIFEIEFYKNGKKSNSKNAAYNDSYGYKAFCLNGKLYGDESDFIKESWRRFIKLQAFL